VTPGTDATPTRGSTWAEDKTDWPTWTADDWIETDRSILVEEFGEDLAHFALLQLLVAQQRHTRLVASNAPRRALRVVYHAVERLGQVARPIRLRTAYISMSEPPTLGPTFSSCLPYRLQYLVLFFSRTVKKFR
jgi:hypothetical protein